MLVDNSIYRNAYVANGSSKSFAISFPFLTAEHIQVFRGVDAENDALIPASEYTISGAGNENGGTLVMNTAPASGTRIVILRNVPITQLYAYEELDNFSAKSHEDALAKLTMIDQQQQEQIDRSVKLSATDPRTPEQYAQELFDAHEEVIGMPARLEAQLVSIGDRYVLMLEEKVLALLGAANAFNGAAVAEIAEDMPEGSIIELPELMQYVVGSNMLMLFYNGTVSYEGQQYREVGALGSISRTVTMLHELRAGDMLQFRVIALHDYDITATNTTMPRKLSDRFADIVNVKDFGAVGDGVTDDTEAIQAALAAYPDTYINMSGLTCAVSAFPSSSKFFNGFFVVDGLTLPADYTLVRAGAFGVAIGENAGGSMSGYRANRDLVAIGAGAAKNMKDGRNNIAIGERALQKTTSGRHNIAIGVEALADLESTSATGNDILGTRNIAIGGNAGRFINTGNRNLLIGRDVAHALTSGTCNIVMGNGALLGDCPNSLEEGVVINQTPLEGDANIIIGVAAAQYQKSRGAVVIGLQAGQYMKDGLGTVLIGENAGQLLNQDISPFGTAMSSVSITGTFIQQASTTITITTNEASGVEQGGKVRLRFTDGELGRVSAYDDIWFDVVTVVSETQFTIYTDQIRTDSGAVLLSQIASASAANSAVADTVFIGRIAGSQTPTAYRATVVGSRAGVKCGNRSTYIGAIAGNSAIGADAVAVGASTLSYASGNGNVAIGSLACGAITTGEYNVAVGYSALSNTTTSSNNVALGIGALMKDLNGDNFNYSTCVGIGPYTRTSGDFQVQLGNAEQTPYAYAAVQVRSDARDKADVQDCHLGLNFINALRPVDYRWDYRDDYLENVEVGRDEEDLPIYETVRHAKDGSKKRKRLHHGFIAQEVEAVMEELGVSFGGFQNHKINGGADVLTIGYTELIAPLCKAIQELSTRLAVLESKLGVNHD